MFGVAIGNSQRGRNHIRPETRSNNWLNANSSRFSTNNNCIIERLDFRS